MTDYEFILEDRIAKIRAINEQYDLEHNGYIAYSGGKDSTILHYLLDLALPNNKIPRVYSNTGIEYKMVREYVKSLAKNDDRFVILTQTRNIKQTLEKYGYPFKSKEHSQKLNVYRVTGMKSIELQHYLDENRKDKFGNPSKYICPKQLRYQFTPDFKLHCSKECCTKLKKDLMKHYEKENNRFCVMTGMRKEEKGSRSNLQCTIFKDGKLKKFHPISVVTEKWENEFIEKNNIRLCELYYPPFNFIRTGCKGCPFDLNLEKNLKILAKLLPNEYKQCEILWKPVYDEYRRIGYRLKWDGRYLQTSIYDFLEEDEDANKSI